MKINLGDFGNTAQQPASQPHTEIIGQALAGLGSDVEQLGLEKQRRREELAAAQASTALTDHEIAVNNAVEDLKDKMSRGELSPDEAQQAYSTATSKLAAPAPEHLSAPGQEYLARGYSRNTAQGSILVDRAADATRRAQFKANFATGLDNLGKLAGMPGADVPAIIDQADTYRGFGRNAGLPPDLVDKSIQDFKDQTWLNHAQQRFDEGMDSPDALKQLQFDLTDSKGLYADKLDTNKRNAVLRGVVERQDVLINRAEAQANRREALGERALGQIDRQIASGVPATPDMWATWASQVQGTSAAPEFQQRIQDERTVQDVLRLPIDQQVKYVQDKQTALLSGGGSLTEAANLARLSTAVTQNVNQLQQAPLLYAAARTAQPVAPIDVSALLTPDGAKAVGAQLAARADTISALRKQYGAQIQNKPLLPEEAAALSGALEKSRPDQAAQLFGVLRNAAGDDETYSAIMQQIAPDSPVKALAGLLTAKQRKLTLERNWVRSDVVASSPDVATTLLEGEALLNKSKLQKAEDGKPKTGLYLPNTTQLQDDFTARVGDAFAGRPGAADKAFQAVQAYYVGKAAKTGRLASGSQDVDPDIVKEAISATIGDVVNYNGNGSVLIPWGMDPSTFGDRVKAALANEVKRRGMSEGTVAQLPGLGLRNEGDGTYYVLQGRNFLYDRHGQPVILNVAGTPVPPAPALSRIR